MSNESPPFTHGVDANVTHIAALHSNDLLAASLSALAVFVLSPLIIGTNALILAAMYRFKKLRTPSNYLVASLATSDLGLGVVAPFALYLESASTSSSHVGADSTACLLPYCGAIGLGGASILAMAAIAVDRFTSLAQPLRYNNIITHRSMERYVAALWVYALLMGMTPVAIKILGATAGDAEPAVCSWSSTVAPRVGVLLALAAYGPAALVVLGCYGYIYVVARRHARAISVEQALRHHQAGSPCRYGWTLAATVGLFFVAWMPFVTLMVSDAAWASRMLRGWTAVLVAIPVFASGACNPWMYGFRNAELSGSVLRVMELLVGCPEPHRSAHDEYAAHTSCASHVHLCAVSTNRTTLVLLPSRYENAETALTPKETAVHLNVP